MISQREQVCDPPMAPSNDSAVATAQEWMGHLDAWINSHTLEGFDPFDIKQHPWIRAAQPYPLLRKATSGLCDFAPHAMRRWLCIQPTHNPKAYALVAMGKLRMYQLTGNAEDLAHAERCLAWLTEHAAPNTQGIAWGYPFDVQAKGLVIPAGTPVGVVTAIAGQAFCLAYAVTQETRYLETARGIAAFITDGLPRLEGPEGTYCFAYTPADRRRVHNANLLAAEHLFRVGAWTNDPALTQLAEPSLAFTLRAQRDDGAWTYGEMVPGDPYEAGLMDLVDHHHTGFVLRSLHSIWQTADKPELEAVIRKGYHYYRQQLFRPPWGMPINAYGEYPVDIHACAEAVLCSSVLARDLLAARGFADLPLRWAHYYLRDRATDLPYYRKYRRFVSKISYPRWGTAWMYYAMSEYLYTRYR